MPTRQLDKAELCGAVQQAVGSLSDRQRMAVLLAKFEHMSYADIGDRDGYVAAGGEVAVVASADATCASRCSRTWIAGRRSTACRRI